MKKTVNQKEVLVTWDIMDHKDVRLADDEWSNLTCDNEFRAYRVDNLGRIGGEMRRFEKYDGRFLAVQQTPHEPGERARQFDERIFFGAGEHTVRAMNRLHQIVDEAMALESGLQQPDRGCEPDFDNEDDEAEHWKKQKETRALLQQDKDTALIDVIVALGGEHLLRRRLRVKQG